MREMEYVRAVVARSVEASARVHRLAARSIVDATANCAFSIGRCLLRGGRVWIAGNGGSAAAAQHFAAELSGRYIVGSGRRSLPVISLTSDTVVMTAIANDFGIEEIFARQISGSVHADDVVMVISVSGRSPNVLKAVVAARACGAEVLALTGGEGDALAGVCDEVVKVPSSDTPRVQEVHGAVLHAIAAVCESMIKGEDGRPDSEPSPGSAKRYAQQKLATIDTVAREREVWRLAGKTLVWTNGCFDILHVGHVRFLEAARDEGDVLVVGVNSDESVRRLKGASRPIVTVGERAEILAALECVDRVVVFDADTPVDVIARLKPDVHCKGSDYAPGSGRPMPEAEVIRSYGGRIVYVPLVNGVSTTGLVDRVRESL